MPAEGSLKGCRRGSGTATMVSRSAGSHSSRSTTSSAAAATTAGPSSSGTPRCCRTIRTIRHRTWWITTRPAPTASTWPATGATWSGSTARSATCLTTSIVNGSRRTRWWSTSPTTAGFRAPTGRSSHRGRNCPPTRAAYGRPSCSASRALFRRAPAMRWRAPSTSCRRCWRPAACPRRPACRASTCSTPRPWRRGGRFLASASRTRSSISTIRRRASSGDGRSATTSRRRTSTGGS